MPRRHETNRRNIQSIKKFTTGEIDNHMLKEFQSVKEIFGPIVYVEGVEDAAYKETVEITMPNGEKKKGLLFCNLGTSFVTTILTTAGVAFFTTATTLLPWPVTEPGANALSGVFTDPNLLMTLG